MLVLAIDSSTTVATVAVANQQKILGEYTIDDKYTHSQKLMPMVESLLNQLGIDISEIDLLAVTKGPGSFTGLRIGVATVKSLSYALEKPIVGESSLSVLANGHKYFNGIVVPMIDARNKRVFASAYSGNGKSLKVLLKEDALEVSALLEKLKDTEKDLLFTGDGSVSYKEMIENALGDRAVFSECHLNIPKASSLCALALVKYKNNEVEDTFSLVPSYLRLSQAEQQRESAKNG